MMVTKPTTPARQMTLDSSVKNPLRHVLRAYDRAIRACDQQDELAARRALALLRASLDGDSPESIGFDGIFVWCERAVAARDFAEPSRRLATLRKAWQTADQVRPATEPLPQRTLQMVRSNT
jgi:hypothetical protein